MKKFMLLLNYLFRCLRNKLKIASLLLVLLIPAVSWGSTLYLTSTSAGTQIYIHKWGGTDATTWPGFQITNSSVIYNNGSGGFYSNSLNSTNYLLHNNSGNQTGNLTITEDTWGQYNGTTTFNVLMTASTKTNTGIVQFASGGYSGGWGTHVNTTYSAGTGNFTLIAPYTSGNGFDIYINGTKFLYVATSSISGYSAGFSSSSVTVTFNPTTGALSMASNSPSISSIVSSLPSFSSTQTYKGATVTVTGTNLSAISSIKLGGVNGTTITTSSPTQIGNATSLNFVVPDGTSGGTVYVSDGTNSATSTQSLTNLGYISANSSNWSVGSTWLGGTVPSSTDNVSIAHGTSVMLDGDKSVANLTINSTTGNFSNGLYTLTIAANGTLTNNNSGNGFTRNSGTISFAGNGTVVGTVGFNNVIIAGGVNFGSVSTINGTLTINAGGYVNTNAPAYASGSTLKYNSTGSYGRGTEWSTTSGGGYPYHVQISNSTLLNMGANGGTGTTRQCAGNLTVDAGSTFSMNETSNVMTVAVTVIGNIINNGTITLSGSAGGDIKTQGNINDSGTFNANNRAVFFNGSNTQVIQGTGTFDISYVRINKSGGSVQLASNLTCAGPNGGNAMEIDGSTSILDLNGFTLYLGAAGVSSTYNSGIATPGSIKASSTSAITILGSGALVGSLNFTNGSQTLNNLTIDRQSSGTVSLGSALTLTGQLTLTNGTFTNSTNLTLANDASIVKGGGVLSSAPTFGSTINLTYNSTSTKGNEFPSSDIITSLSINNTAGINLSDNRNIPTLSIGSGSSLTVASGKQLTVNTAMSNSGTLNLNSDINGTATLITPATITNSSAIYNIQQYLPTVRNWYVSSPVSGATTPAGYTVYQYVEPGTNSDLSVSGSTAFWQGLSQGSAFSTGRGYVVLPASSASTITFTGTLNNGNITTAALTRSTGVAKEGFNLIGNPYSSFIDLSTMDTTNVLSTYWMRTRNLGGTAYVFDTYNLAAGLGVFMSGKPASAFIPPMQSFWVRVKQGVPSTTLTFSNAMRAHSNNQNNIFRSKSLETVAQQAVYLDISNGVNNDQTILVFNPKASNGFDAYDSPKMSNNSVAVPEIYTSVGNEDLAINGMNSIPYNTEIALGFNTETAGNFMLKASQLVNFDSSVSVYLKDYNDLVNTPVQLSPETTYNFSSDVTTNNTSRFALIFKSSSISTGINGNGSNTVWISVGPDNKLIINGLNGVATASVYNAIGQKMISKRLDSAVSTLDASLLPGVYTLVLNSDGKNSSRKVIIK